MVSANTIPIGPTGKPDLMYDLVKFVANTRYEDLPPEMVDLSKRVILDTLAVAIAGSSQEGIKPVVDLVSDCGGKQESTIWVYGGKYPALMAALAIGPMCRAIDMGDVHPVGAHTGEYIIPALLPLAERQESVTGRELITAYALGAEVMARIGLSVLSVTGLFESKHNPMWRIWGPTVAGAKLLGLNKLEMWDALGIAYSLVGGDLQRGPDGALSLRVEHGFTASNAIKSVLLSQRGITGAKNILQGVYGFYAAFEPKHDISLVTHEMGKVYNGRGVMSITS